MTKSGIIPFRLADKKKTNMDLASELANSITNGKTGEVEHKLQMVQSHDMTTLVDK